jgi:hypothetical protein
MSPEDLHAWRVLRVAATSGEEPTVVVSIDEQHTVSLGPDQAADLAANIIAAVIAATRDGRRP